MGIEEVVIFCGVVCCGVRPPFAAHKLTGLVEQKWSIGCKRMVVDLRSLKLINVSHSWERILSTCIGRIWLLSQFRRVTGKDN